MKPIEVRQSPTADTRTCDFANVTRETLYDSSEQHIADVRAALDLFVHKLEEASLRHDFDKLTDIATFHADFTTGFKQTLWWDTHRRINRHHLTQDDGVRDDVNLIDVLDFIADCVMAGMARSGSVRAEVGAARRQPQPEPLQAMYPNGLNAREHAIVFAHVWQLRHPQNTTAYQAIVGLLGLLPFEELSAAIQKTPQAEALRTDMENFERQLEGVAPLASAPAPHQPEGAKVHTLKCWPIYFAAIKSGQKRFELRKADRDFEVGDCLVLQEFEPSTEKYSGEVWSVRVTYRTTVFMQDGFVALGIEPWAAEVRLAVAEARASQDAHTMTLLKDRCLELEQKLADDGRGDWFRDKAWEAQKNRAEAAEAHLAAFRERLKTMAEQCERESARHAKAEWKDNVDATCERLYAGFAKQLLLAALPDPHKEKTK